MEKRYIFRDIERDALADGKMAFISGPRQVGKTTLAKGLLLGSQNYFSWDDDDFRRAWSKSASDAVAARGPGPIVLDEIHKQTTWKRKLKGLYDTRGGKDLPIVVTGSARLDFFRRGGDSLLGRYLPYRLHPFSVGERETPPGPNEITVARVARFPWHDLKRLGGFPEPLLGGSEAKARRWSRLRLERLIAEDIRDLRAVRDLQALRVLVDLLPERVGSPLSINNLREDAGVAYATAYEWIGVLESLYHCFLIRPWAGKLKRTLAAEPKLYLFDPLPIGDEGARSENLVALHLLKACHYWTDLAHGVFELRYVRDKERREVDFLVVRDGKPWLMVEAKTTETEPSRALMHYRRLLAPEFAVQLVDVDGFERDYSETKVKVVSYDRFLAGLV